MAHFYKYNNGDPFFIKEVETPAQAKKLKQVFPSVTTVLGVLTDPFIDGRYKPMKTTELSRQHPNKTWEQIKDLVYGLREHPVTKEMIPSSEFGTEVHKRIEEYVLFDLGKQKNIGDSDWDEYAIPFVDWYRNSEIVPRFAEKIVTCSRVKTAGSVDFIGQYKDRTYFLADYKCRSCKDNTPKFYLKDKCQLGIEALFLKQELNLNYIPECISICIDTNTAKHHHKVWKLDDVLHGIKITKLCSKLYWETRMK